MGRLVSGDDGLPVEDGVGDWVDEKHRVLRTYLELHAVGRVGFSNRRNAYIDAFCGPGRAKVLGSDRYVDGSPVVAWKASLERNAPFAELYIGDSDEARRAACAARLRKLNAPVIEVTGDAAEAWQGIVAKLDPYGLHCAFIDPYSLGEFRLELLRTLAGVRRMDILVHLSSMDLFRSFDFNYSGEQWEFDKFAPGWRSKVPPGLPKDERRSAVIEYWKTLVDRMGMAASPEMHAIRNSGNRDVYVSWLLLIARQELAQRFWRSVLRHGPEADRRLMGGP
jgi:three-Cys-motif partner protein